MRNEARREIRSSRLIALSVDGIRLRTGTGTEDIDRDSLRLEPGTLTLVIGTNGSGKTVWLEKLAGLRDPEGLSVSYGSEPLWLPGRKWRGRRLNPRALLQYAYAGQSPEQALFMRSLQEELLFSLRPFAGTNTDGTHGLHDIGRMEQALEAVGISSSWLGRDPYRMSGGEKRRTALAALFVTPAPWLFLDEPTAGLDREGHEKLSGYLQQLKSQGRGIVMVSHDLDWALPLANRVLLTVPGGHMRCCIPQELIRHPEWMEEAGMRVPEWMRMLRMAWQSGNADVERLWDPAGTADALDIRVLDGKDGHPTAAPASATAATDRHSKRREPQPADSPLRRLDPRAVWLGYALLSAGIFSLSSWRGLLVGGIMVVLLVILGKIPLKRWRSLIAGFVCFSVVMAGLAAALTAWSRVGTLGWEMDAFTGTLFPMARTLSVLLIGLGMPLVMTPLSLRRALEQLVPMRGKTPEWWQRIVLTVTLTIRFVPVLLSEWERFGRIYLARGKMAKRSPRNFVRRLRGITLPLLLALFRLGDEAATALESRGVRRNMTPTRATRLQWRWRDTAAAVFSAGLAGLLWLIP